MGIVQVPAAWIAQGTLPTCCARHGSVSTQRTQRAFYTPTPIWVLLIAPIGLILAIIAAMAVRQTVSGQLPTCDTCSSDRRRFRAAALGAWVLDIVALVLAAKIGAVGFLFWLVVTIAALVFTFSGDRYRVSGQVNKDLAWVTLKGAHETFIRDINDALHRPAMAPPPAQAPVSIAAPTASDYVPSSYTILPQ